MGSPEFLGSVREEHGNRMNGIDMAIGRTGKRRVYIDVPPGQEYDAGNVTVLLFTANLGRVVYVVHGSKDGSRRVSFVVTDRTEAKRYDTVWTRTLRAGDDGTLRYVAESGKKFMRVTYTLQ